MKIMFPFAAPQKRIVSAQLRVAAEQFVFLIKGNFLEVPTFFFISIPNIMLVNIALHQYISF